MPDLVSRLIDITRRTLDVENKPITVATNFVEDLGADSLDCVDLMMAVEDAFDVEFADDELSGLTTVGAVADYLRKQAGRAALSRPAGVTGSPFARMSPCNSDRSLPLATGMPLPRQTGLSVVPPRE